MWLGKWISCISDCWASRRAPQMDLAAKTQSHWCFQDGLPAIFIYRNQRNGWCVRVNSGFPRLPTSRLQQLRFGFSGFRMDANDQRSNVAFRDRLFAVQKSRQWNSEGFGEDFGSDRNWSKAFPAKLVGTWVINPCKPSGGGWMFSGVFEMTMDFEMSS